MWQDAAQRAQGELRQVQKRIDELTSEVNKLSSQVSDITGENYAAPKPGSHGQLPDFVWQKKCSIFNDSLHHLGVHRECLSQAAPCLQETYLHIMRSFF